MTWKNMSIGSKKPKKEVNVNVTKKHIIGFFAFLCLIVIVINYILVNSGFYTVEEMKIKCNTGEYEDVLENKTVYCGQHYTDLKDVINEETYINMEKIILGGFENELE